jgi:hypothetical protein
VRREINSFSLHAAVRVEAHDHKRLEQLCRYITRPALSDERVQLNAAGQVTLKLKTPWRDGTTHLVMSRRRLREGAAAAAVPALPIQPQAGRAAGHLALLGRAATSTSALMKALALNDRLGHTG